MGGGNAALFLLALPLVAFLLLPLVALALAVPPGAWLGPLRSPVVLQAVRLTLFTTALSTALCVVFGTPVAYLLARVPFRGRALLDTLTDLPLTMPPVVAGVALLLAFGRRGLMGKHFSALGIEIAFSTAAVVMAQVFIASPFFVKAAKAGFAGVDPDLEDAAYTLGASRWRAFWSVTVPLAGPSLLGGAVLAWARALSEFGATMLFAGNFLGRTQTLTLAVMSAMDTDLNTAIAVSIVALALALATLILAKSLLRRWEVPGR